ICIATCAFSEMNGMALRPLPVVQNPAELVALQQPVSYPAFRRFRAQDRIFSGVAAYAAPIPFAVSVSGGPDERTWGHVVSSAYFANFGGHSRLGRFFDPGQERAPQRDVIVSERFWRNHLGADYWSPGKTLRINGYPYSVIGIAPPGFLGASPLLFPADL